ncbi:MAG: Brp/Blh family beta-carotene 15,15'-dioxygenase, partial [Bacteroidota bacterium]
MDRFGFIFLAAAYVMVSIVGYLGSIPMDVQVTITLLMVGVLGLPHGAIDHILFLDESNISPLRFYGFYIGLILLYIGGWLLQPQVGLALFLILSAYHFGESQFSDFNLGKVLNPLLRLSWGISVISGLVYYNYSDLAPLMGQATEASRFSLVFHPSIHKALLAVSTTATLGILGVQAWKSKDERESMLREIYLLGLIQATFYVLPLLIGFTLFFTIIHSFRVLHQEFHYLKRKITSFDLSRFISLLLPYTLISVVGGGVLIYLALEDVLQVSLFVMLLMLISALTLPHSIVMSGFY